MQPSLLRKYNVPGPRYTSYPTVPYWDKVVPSPHTWHSHVRQSFSESKEQGVSLYIHLPYCERLCTYCGCNTHITVNHAVELPYVEALLREWQMYVSLLGESPKIQAIHLGGGTPTFFSPENLTRLMLGIREQSYLSDTADLSFEAHPHNTSLAHLRSLYRLGFRRLSLGIQDFDPDVQKQINRIQSYEEVENITTLARQIGYSSVNYDLIFGLPRQTIATVQQTFRKTLRLKPDRIAFYSYAHVPWMKPAQKSYEKHLPTQEEKRALYEAGKQLLERGDYREVGMDHFALPTDPLHEASSNGTLHRNFMGYTTQATRLMIGLGASAISDTWTAFGQNAKTVREYLQGSSARELPLQRGHVLTGEDLVLRKHILNLMCRGKTTWDTFRDENQVMEWAWERLAPLEEDGLVDRGRGSIVITPQGKPFVRNVCMALDARLWRDRPETPLFSSVV